jgi:hypothetical protein
MYEISKEAKANQLKLISQLLSLQGSLLTKEQKAMILRVTEESGILQGFKEMDNCKTQNSFKIISK